MEYFDTSPKLSLTQFPKTIIYLALKIGYILFKPFIARQIRANVSRFLEINADEKLNSF